MTNEMDPKTLPAAYLLNALKDPWFSFGWRALSPEAVEKAKGLRYSRIWEYAMDYFEAEVYRDVVELVAQKNLAGATDDLDTALFNATQGLRTHMYEVHEMAREK